MVFLVVDAKRLLKEVLTVPFIQHRSVKKKKFCEKELFIK